MDVAELQERIEARYGEGDAELGRQALATVLAEEVGELATAARAGDDGALGEEAADVAFLAFCLANLAGADLGERLREKYLAADPGEVGAGWERAGREAHGIDDPNPEGDP